jgi:hypothetical protein
MVARYTIIFMVYHDTKSNMVSSYTMEKNEFKNLIKIIKGWRESLELNAVGIAGDKKAAEDHGGCSKKGVEEAQKGEDNPNNVIEKSPK